MSKAAQRRQAQQQAQKKAYHQRQEQRQQNRKVGSRLIVAGLLISASVIAMVSLAFTS